LLGWALWSLKPHSTPPIRWSVIFVLTGSIGFVFATGLFKLHRIVEEYSIDFIESLFDTQRDPYQTTTAMGKIGKLKLSGKILMRIQIRDNTLLAPKQPFLLKEASYNVYYENAWFNKQVGFEDIKAIETENAWPLAKATQHSQSANIRLILQKGKSRGLLALPANATKIMSDADISLSRNELGAVQFRANPILEEYELILNHDAQYPSTLSDADQLVPTDLRRFITRIKNRLQLDSQAQNFQSRSNAISSIRHFFRTKFSYTTYLRRSLIRKNALLSFFERGSGHCEYFASATVMLLRSAGIPARYNVGYSVQEFDAEEQVYIVRARHRHAWATAYLDNEWITVDTTPDRWLLADQETAPLFEPISDWISGIQYRIRVWQKENTAKTFTVYYVSIAILLLIIFLLRIQRK
ncbi:MAG: transglutaminase family protein, partial [Thiohalomonadales bacterium]